MKVERLSARVVKPRDTAPFDGPPPLVYLSNFDLAIASVHVEILYAYNAPVPPTSLLALEEGLSKVLCEYREWAGRLTRDASTGRPAIELNDAGAVLVAAEAGGKLEDLWPFNPSPLLLDLIPINRGVPELLLVQVTRFACGGLTLGVARHHQVADGQASSEFMEAWASMVQGGPIACSPLHDRSALIARDPPQAIFDHTEYPPQRVFNHTEYQNPQDLAIDCPKLSIKKLHFSVQLLAKIKEQAMEGTTSGEGVVYSTFVSLLAHLWKCITQVRGLGDEEGVARARVVVDVRKRLNPPLPQGFFGNVICHTWPHAKLKDVANKPLCFVATCVHEAIKKVNNEYCRLAMDFIELEPKNYAQIDKIVSTPDLCVTSWVTLPLYKLDFGWGTPMFAGTPFIPFADMVLFTPSHKKDGSIDLVLGLFASDMKKLESICFAVDR